MAAKGEQQVEFSACENNAYPLGIAEFPRNRIDLPAVELDGVVGAVLGVGQGSGPTQDSLDAGQQFVRVERLGDVVVGAHFEADHPRDGIAGSREHDDRKRR